MSTEVVTTNAKAPARTAQNSVLIRMAQKFEMDPQTFMDIIMNTCMPSKKDAPAVTKEQLAAFLLVADQYNLNPLTKQIYAFPNKSGGISPIVPIDGWYQIMNSHPDFDGIEFFDTLDAEGRMLSIKARIYRKNRAHAVEITEYMDECRRNTDPWIKWPRRMLRHKAVIQAARAAFALAGIYDQDEGERIRGDVEPSSPALALRPVMALAAPPAPEPEIDPPGPAEPEVQYEPGQGGEAQPVIPLDTPRDADGRYPRGPDPEENPACPKCAGPMHDWRARSVALNAPEWACMGALKGAEQCDGRRWKKTPVKVAAPVNPDAEAP